MFDQNDEEGGPASQPQDPSQAYNPFDDFTQGQQAESQELLQLDSEVVGHAMVNEIDEALGEDEDDEFGNFV